MNVREARKKIIEETAQIYSVGEGSAIARLILEHLFPQVSNNRSLDENIILSEAGQNRLNSVVDRLKKNEPVQYILNEAWFCGLKLHVDNRVLIPRPETEELVEWVISNCKFPFKELSILDIGTGSGCIPIALKKRLRKADVWGCDINTEALSVAQQNAALIGTAINFLQINFTDRQQWAQLPTFDTIVSNPPYIPAKGRNDMSSNVIDFEPATALFVPDDDPLLFYKLIASFGLTHLNPDGSIYVEIHEDLGKDIVTLFQEQGYETELKKDMQQKDRMIRSGLKK